ncbi:MAG TPA: polysaccharide biosynthesis/export family protein [Sphingomicrobium sp.]|jgi:polysaccharide export outer membrane protein
MKHLLVAAIACPLTACASTPPLSPTITGGSEAYSLIPPATAFGAGVADYRIGPLDKIDVTVFQEPEISSKAIEVDASGRIALPLIGTVEAKGRTASQLSSELERLFGAKYLRNPQVTVTVASSVSQKVSVQGEVVEPGVYPITGPTTLLDVLALAKGETEVAKLNQVVVFRNVNGARMGAVFDVASIRRGLAADPVIQGNDTVVVGYSAASRVWQNVVRAAPLLNVFTRIGPIAP